MDSVARVDGAERKTLEDEVREVAESRPYRAFAFTIESRGRVLEL